MKPTTRSFIWGILIGILLIIALLVAFGFGYYYLKIKPLRDQASGELEVPRLPPVEGFAFDQFGLTTLAGQSYPTGI